MTLGYVVPAEGIDIDIMLVALAARMKSRNLRIAGAVQHNRDSGDTARCHMDLEILTGHQVLRISQDLGAHAKGCRLDPGALENAVGLVLAAVTGGASGTGLGAVGETPDLLIVNKFGKQEIDGRGFRPVIAAALDAEIPVLVAVRPSSVAAFMEFAGDMATEVAASDTAIAEWIDTVLAQPRNATATADR